MVWRAAVVEQCCIAAHQAHRQLLEEAGDGDALLLPCVPGQGAAQPLDLSYGTWVPGNKAFCSDRQKGNEIKTKKVKKSKLTIESQSQNLKLRTKTYSRCGLVVGATGESKLFKIKK